MKGIILAGGKGTRLYPMTKPISKHLLPIYDKPLIYYPLSVLMLAKIRQILIITTPNDVSIFQTLLGDGSSLGISLTYMIQADPRGIADAFLIGKDFIGEDPVCLVLGDNFFYGQHLTKLLVEATQHKDGALIFTYPVKDPSNYGIVQLDKAKKIVSVVEKPRNSKSNLAVPGLYFFDHHVKYIAGQLKPSARGELEITDVLNYYLSGNQLDYIPLGRGMNWFDTGTPQGMHHAAQFVEMIQSKQGNYIACLEEIAWRRGFIDSDQLRKIGTELAMTDYGQYILTLIDEE